jgi:DNA-binding PadR family transcriptional regulator
MGSGKSPRLTTQTLKVLGVLVARPGDELAGSEIASVTKLSSGTLYPILLRLEEAGWLQSHWERGNPSDLGRPRKRLYSMTGLGSKQTRLAFRDVASAIGGLAWS